MTAMLGRLFIDADDRPGAAPTAIVTADFWQSRLGGDPHVIGESLELDGTPYEIIGVLSPGRKFLWRSAEVYLPLGRTQNPAEKRSEHRSIGGPGPPQTRIKGTAGKAKPRAIIQPGAPP